MKGIMFKQDMVKAIMEGRKTVTRRIMKPPPPIGYHSPFSIGKVWVFSKPSQADKPFIIKPRYRVGEVVYVKEAWAINERGQILLKSEHDSLIKLLELPDIGIKWNSPLFLKAEYARTFLEIKGVRPERLQEITSGDAENEGAYQIPPYPFVGIRDGTAMIGAFSRYWDSINPQHPWADNGWVWREEFKLVPRT